MIHTILLAALFACGQSASLEALTALSSERMIFQTEHGDIEMAFYPQAAPLTVQHILEVAKLGGYNTNHFFRVDKNFVAQTADITTGRRVPPDERQRRADELRVPLEVHEELQHTRRGLLSMARHDDPNSGGTSFSIMLNAAPHLDMQYTIFGEVVGSLEALASMEAVDTTRDGIFVMPKGRIEIFSSYVTGFQAGSCEAQLTDLQHRFDSQSQQLQNLRSTRLP